MTYSVEKKLWLLVAFFYVLPVIVNIFYIYNVHHLTGDYTAYSFEGSFFDLISVGLLYLLPILFIYMILRVKFFSRPAQKIRVPVSLLFWMICILAFVALTFGAIPTGGQADSGIGGVVQRIAAKFNPYYLYLILVASTSSGKKVILSTLAILIIGFAQKSLAGYLIAIMGLAVHAAIHEKISRRQLIQLVVILLPLSFFLGPLIELIYELRNSARGSSISIDSDLIYSYVLGRLNSISSLYSIIYGDCCGIASDSYYSIEVLIERIFGVSLLDYTSPTQIFNDFVLGTNVDYAIFTGTAGSLAILLKTIPLSAILNCAVLLVELKIIYAITPINLGRSKYPFFFLLIFFIYLSGDAWELSLLFQSVIILRVTMFFAESFRLSFMRGSVDRHKTESM